MTTERIVKATPESFGQKMTPRQAAGARLAYANAVLHVMGNAMRACKSCEKCVDIPQCETVDSRP